MKKFIRFFALLFLLGILTISCSCSCKKNGGINSGGNEPEIKITSVTVVNTSLPGEVLTTNALTKLENIQLKVVKSDNSEEIINVKQSMLKVDDLNKLQTEGTHKIKISYENFDVEVELIVKKPKPEPQKLTYSFYVEDIAGKPLSDFYVKFYLGDEKLAEGYTDNTGTYSTELLPNKYEIIVEAREGYYLNEESFVTDLVGTPITTICELDSLADIEAPEYTHYELGDLMYDFTLTDIEGNVLNLYDLLAEGKTVILNFWYVGCSACQYEFPYMIKAYDSTYKNANEEDVKYSDDIVIIAINNGIAGGGDTLQDVKNYKEAMGLNFNVAFDYDMNKDNLTMDPALTTFFSIEAYPTTVVIDKYGLIAEIGKGAVTDTNKWTQLFDTYLAEDYKPVYKGANGDGPIIILPDKVQADSSVLEQAVNGTNYDGTSYTGNWTPETNDDKEYSWPWEVVEYDGKQTIVPTNKDINSSFSIVYTTVDLKEGEAFTFDYYASSENYDKLYIIVDGTICTNISGRSLDWEKSYAYVAIEDREYTFGFCYLKDQSYAEGDDCVYITNVRVENSEEIDQETYIFRNAATGSIDEFTMSYTNYIVPVYNAEDGYYHVNTIDGPLLFANMLGATKWNSSNLYTISLEGLCIGYDGVDYNDLIEEYTIYANNSTIGYCPVTKELANALQQVTKKLGHELAMNNENQWLEVCVYYSAYGTNGVELGVPTTGVCYFEPIEFEGDGIDTPAQATGDYNRIISPRGMIFSFTPTKSGVYKYYSTGKLETIGWICDQKGVVVEEEEMGLREFAKKATEGQLPDMNFVCYVYLDAGNTYLFRACFYDIYEFSEINVEMQYMADSLELLTIASPGWHTSSTDEMGDIIAGNYVDVEIGSDGYYHVIDSKAKDTAIYFDVVYITNILSGKTILESIEAPYFAFDFTKDEYGYPIYDSEGYMRYTALNEDWEIINYYICQDSEGYIYYTETLNEGDYTPENGYTYLKLTPEEIEQLKGADCTEAIKEYIDKNMITDETSELYGCVKVNEDIAKMLSLLMDKYQFENVAFSWLKLCYYYEYLGA